MGLRTASVRRPHAEVMAPALTDTAQPQNFNLPPKSHLQPASPINSYETKTKYLPTGAKESLLDDQLRLSPLNCDDLSDTSCNLDQVNLFPKKLLLDDCLTKQSGASDNALQLSNMSVSPPPMGDQDTKMGLQKTALNVSNIHKVNSDGNSDVDQIINSVCVDGEIAQNVEDIMQVFKSIETSEQVNASNSDLNEEVLDLTHNLSSFEKEFLEDVDMMNISMEDQQDALETEQKLKESQAKDILEDLQRKHARVERRLDFLRRRIHKLQARHMGQQISGEIVGVFEQVHRSLKRNKDLHDTSKPYLNPCLMEESIEKPKPMSYGSAKSLLRKLETSALLQANAASRQKHSLKYFGSGSLEVPTFRSNVTGQVSIPPWTPENKFELKKVTGQLRTQLRLVQEEVDSEATESSSGAESCDELQSYNNPHQQYLSIQKRALWKYSTDRAAIAARWTWLQSQISDLEYRIRQHTELHKQIRTSKGSVVLGGTGSHFGNDGITAVNGYRGQLPGSSETSCETWENQCSRTRPLQSFRKRKLLQVSGLHAVSKKAARPSTTRCGCVSPAGPCALCTGRTDPTHPRDPPDTLSKAEKVALLDTGFHPVFSLPEDASQSVHLEAIMKTSEWQQRSTRMKTMRVMSKSERLEPKSSEHRGKKLEHRKKYARLKPSTVSALSEKIKSKIRGRKASRLKLKKRDPYSSQMAAMGTDAEDEEMEAMGDVHSTTKSLDSPCSSPLLQMQSISGYSRNRNRIDSYDIDNIVIPYSVAASTRVEKLQYKEILTPKWRIVDPELIEKCDTKNNGAVHEFNPDSDTEDMSEEALTARHERCEHDERKKFLSYLKVPVGYGRQRSHKRTDSMAESSGANTPDPMSPPHAQDGETPLTSPPATPLPAEDVSSAPPSVAMMRRRTVSQCRYNKEDGGSGVLDAPDVPPYERRAFPLGEDTYKEMVKVMPENHQLKTNTRAQDCSDASSSAQVEEFSDGKPGSPDTESTESAVGDCDEDPNDPEWMDVERASRDRHRR